MRDLHDLITGPAQKFEPPDWSTFLEQRWKAYWKIHGAPTRLDMERMKAAFNAGWIACMEELDQKSETTGDSP